MEPLNLDNPMKWHWTLIRCPQQVKLPWKFTIELIILIPSHNCYGNSIELEFNLYWGLYNIPSHVFPLQIMDGKSEFLTVLPLHFPTTVKCRFFLNHPGNEGESCGWFAKPTNLIRFYSLYSPTDKCLLSLHPVH